MKKFIRAGICILFSLVKFLFIKLFHLNGFKFPLLNLISPITEVEIGKNSKLFLGKLVRMKSGSKIRVRRDAEMYIGENTSLNHGCIFTAHHRIKIGDNVQFGPNVLIYDHDHDFRTEDGLKDLKYKTAPIEIGNNVWIGANVIILRGTKIGNDCVIGAGIVVQGEYKDKTLLLGDRRLIIKDINMPID